MVAIGFMELLMLVVLGGGAAIAVVGICVGAIVLAKRTSAFQGKGTWKAPSAAGPPKSIRQFSPADQPVADAAKWDGSHLVVRSDDWSTKSLFDVPLGRLEQCQITYRFRIQTESLKNAVYPEMWCRAAEKGLFFSRGVDRKVLGTNNWKEVEIPFYLSQGQWGDLLHLNLVFEGPGSVRLKDIEVLVTPLKTE